MLTSAALLGSVVGQLAFGAAADVLGRRGIFIATAIITALASLGAACAWDSSDHSSSENRASTQHAFARRWPQTKTSPPQLGAGGAGTDGRLSSPSTCVGE